MKYMELALELADKANPFPNPKVGCVIVKDDKIIGQGYHKKQGTDHAEIAAIKNAKESIENSTMYVTLEPCNSHGKTPPCVEEVIKQKIKEIYIATLDPNPKTHGNSVKKLKKAGIKVHVGCLEEQADQLNWEFFTEIKNRPYILLKTSMTADGFIAKPGKQTAISSEQSKQWVHQKRKIFDAILIGKNTALIDDPQLSSRLEKTTYPIRIILDTKGNIPSTLKCFKLPGETIILTCNLKYKNKKAKVIRCKKIHSKINLKDALEKLKNEGITSIMVEGGSKIIKEFIDQHLVDLHAYFINPRILKNGMHFYKGITPDNIIEKLKLRIMHSCKKGVDTFILAKND
tara:strand:- start:4623 stop:5657 length:1035 start_codon:yes stop_codon:yes gene_type:complete